jgi:hypothetical protein
MHRSSRRFDPLDEQVVGRSELPEVEVAGVQVGVVLGRQFVDCIPIVSGLRKTRSDGGEARRVRRDPARYAERAEGTGNEYRPERAVGLVRFRIGGRDVEPGHDTNPRLLVFRNPLASGGEVPGPRGEEVVVRVAGEAAVAGVGLDRRQDRGELLVGGHG